MPRLDLKFLQQKVEMKRQAKEKYARALNELRTIDPTDGEARRNAVERVQKAKEALDKLPEDPS
ncbi:MAG TPA: hypothetical protein VFE78_32130 [Gemmataceae bacterium]|jgi:hypothetical protein|nr:hypothetical protein [Gemmataceae bacterium]